MNNAALAANTAVMFQFNNSVISAGDVVMLSIKNPISSIMNYQVWSGNQSAGVTQIVLKNISGGSLSDALVINFTVLKGATA